VTLEVVGPEVPLSVSSSGLPKEPMPGNAVRLAKDREAIARMPKVLLNGDAERDVAGDAR
jgi:hypothetical protein